MVISLSKISNQQAQFKNLSGLRLYSIKKSQMILLIWEKKLSYKYSEDKKCSDERAQKTKNAHFKMLRWKIMLR